MNSYQKAVLVLAVSGTMLVSATPAWIMAEAAPSSSTVKNMKTQQQKTFADLDEKMQKAAQDMIRQLAGKDIELHAITKLPDNKIMIMAKDNPSENNVTIDPKTGKESHAEVLLSFADLSYALQQQALNALQKMEPNKTFTFDKVVHDYYDDGSKAGKVTVELQGKGANVRIVNDKLMHAKIVYGIDQVDGEFIEAAEKAIQAFTGSDITFTKATRQQGVTGNEEWHLANKESLVSVTLGAQTGKVLGVYNHKEIPLISDNKIVKKFKDQDVLAAASSHAEIFGIDFKGYKVKKSNFPFAFELTKKNAPSVSLQIDKNKKIFGMSVSPIPRSSK